MENITLEIGSQSNDLEFDEDGIMKTVHGNEATAQNVRMALTAWKGDFPPVPEHGTDYGRLFSEGCSREEQAEIVRDAVFQEEGVSQVERLAVTDTGRRTVNISFDGQLADGGRISTEVSV